MANQTSKVARQVTAAKNLIASAEAVEAEGRQITDEELEKLGYVQDEGGTWGLDIPDHIAAMLVKGAK
jgi:hypothetical protein